MTTSNTIFSESVLSLYNQSTTADDTVDLYHFPQMMLAEVEHSCINHLRKEAVNHTLPTTEEDNFSRRNDRFFQLDCIKKWEGTEYQAGEYHYYFQLFIPESAKGRVRPVRAYLTKPVIDIKPLPSFYRNQGKATESGRNTYWGNAKGFLYYRLYEFIGDDTLHLMLSYDQFHDIKMEECNLIIEFENDYREI